MFFIQIIIDFCIIIINVDLLDNLVDQNLNNPNQLLEEGEENHHHIQGISNIITNIQGIIIVFFKLNNRTRFNFDSPPKAPAVNKDLLMNLS